MSHPTPHWHRNTGLAFVFRPHMKLLSQAFFFFSVLAHPKTYVSTMVRKGAMLKRPAAGLSSDDEPAAKDVAHVGVCYWPAHEICSLAIVCIWSYLCLALLCGYSSCILSALCL